MGATEGRGHGRLCHQGKKGLILPSWDREEEEGQQGRLCSNLIQKRPVKKARVSHPGETLLYLLEGWLP